MKRDLWLLLHAKWVLDWTSDLGDFCNNEIYVPNETEKCDNQTNV